ncbi:MAG: hypothetical protein GY730_07910, partial [bacterium]|nr:hypothetical protein [bacterium]
MKIFGYKDVQMFFIPMLGAAVSGVEKNPSSVRKAIISLLGPVPGIILGLVLAVVYFKTKNELCGFLSSCFLFINAFNLLPFHPLDGGRFFDHLLFSRNPKIEITFKLLTTLILIGMAFFFKMILIGIFAGFIIISLRATYLSAKIAHSLKSDPDFADESDEFITDEQIARMLNELKNKFKMNSDNAKVLANYIHNIWLRVCNKPASIMATIILIVMIYIPMMSIGIAAPFIIEVEKLISKEKTEGVEEESAVLLKLKGYAKITNWNSYNEQTDEGLGYLLRAYELKSDDAELCYKIGKLFQLKDNYQKAEFYYKRAVQIDDQIPHGWNKLGWTYKYTKQYPKMKDAF